MKRLLRLPEVISTVGLSRSEIYRLEKAGRFPQRIPLTAKTSTWNSEAVEAWVEARIAAREAVVAERAPLGRRLAELSVKARADRRPVLT